MSSEDNSVCVIVRAYNAASYISECLLSLRNQTYQFGIFIKILYDKGSTDNTQQALQKLDFSHLNTENRHFEIVEHENLSPFRSLFNYGLEKFAGSYSYFTILDYDNYYSQNYIDLAVKQLNENNCHFLYSLPKFVDNSKQELPATYKFPAYSSGSLKYRILLGNFIDASTIFMTGLCLDLLITKIQALRSRTFDWIYEDWIIGALALNQCKSHILPTSNIYYRMHSANTTSNNIKNLQNGTDTNRTVLSISAFRLLFRDNPLSRIFCVISIFKWFFYTLCLSYNSQV